MRNRKRAATHPLLFTLSSNPSSLIPSQCTRWPGLALRPARGGRFRSRPPPAATIIPSLVPNFIFRGAVAAQITSRPTNRSGRYTGLMPAKTLALSSPPRLSVSFKSFFARHVLGRHDPRDAEIDLGELVEADLFGQRLGPQRRVAVLRRRR